MYILLIEPDRLLAETYFKAMMAEGHHVVACAGAQTAILAADQQMPDLVVMELQLVEHSGIEFLYEFRSYPEWQNVPVVVQTFVAPGEFSGSWPILKDELGVRAYLYKPHAKLADLLKEVNQVAVPA